MSRRRVEPVEMHTCTVRIRKDSWEDAQDWINENRACGEGPMNFSNFVQVALDHYMREGKAQRKMRAPKATVGATGEDAYTPLR